MQYFDEATKTKVTVSRDISSYLKGKDEGNPERVIKEAIADYQKGLISLDDLSCITGYFYDKLLYKNDYPSELMTILEIGSDLAYLERFSDNFSGELKKVLEYGEMSKGNL